MQILDWIGFGAKAVIFLLSIHSLSDLVMDFLFVFMSGKEVDPGVTYVA